MEKLETKKAEPQPDQSEKRPDQSEDDIFSIEEIRIEELAVDGICGVY